MNQPDKTQENKSRKKKILGGLLLGGIPLLFVLYLILGPVLHGISRDLSAQEMYVVSAWVNVRASSDLNSLKMGEATYGTKLLVYEIEGDWAEVLIQGKKGYVAKKYIADPETYYLLEGLFGDKLASKKVVGAKNRYALVRYLKSKGYLSSIPIDVQKELYDDVQNKEVFQLFTEPFTARYNSVVYADFNGDYRKDAAFVLKNTEANKTRLVIISFDKNDPMNISNTIYDEELNDPWYYIRLAKKGRRYYLGEDGKKNRLPINGLEIGSNRSRKLNDPSFVLLYNGESFKQFEQY